MRPVALVRSVLVCLLLAAGARSVCGQTLPPADLGSIAVRVVPPNADVLIDGERWVSPDSSAPLVVQLPPGRHRIEIRAPGFQPYAAVFDVRPGETTPLNVSLTRGTETSVQVTAQSPPPAAPGIVEVPSTGDGFAFAPDFRITELNHHTTQFLGGYGGMVFAGQLLIGAGGYWQADSPSDMAYGGAVVEWRLWTDKTIALAVHGLGGYGESTLFNPVATFGRGPNNGRHGYGYYGYEGFWIGEPEVQIVARFTDSLRLHVGAGYRFTSAHNDLNGASASFSLQFGR